MLGTGDLIIEDPAICHRNALMRAHRAAGIKLSFRTHDKDLFILDICAENFAWREFFFFENGMPHLLFLNV